MNKIEKISQKYKVKSDKIFSRYLKLYNTKYNSDKAMRKALKTTTNIVKGIHSYHSLTKLSSSRIARKIERTYQKAISVSGKKQLKYRSQLETLNIRKLQGQIKHAKNPELKLRKQDELISLRNQLRVEHASGKPRPIQWFRDSYIANGTTPMSFNEWNDIYGWDAANNLKPLAQGSQYGYIDEENKVVISLTD